MDDQRDYAEEAYNWATMHGEEEAELPPMWFGTDDKGREWRIIADGELCIIESKTPQGWRFNARSDKTTLMELGAYIGVNWQEGQYP